MRDRRSQPRLDAKSIWKGGYKWPQKNSLTLYLKIKVCIWHGASFCYRLSTQFGFSAHLLLIIYRKFFRIVEKGKEKRIIVGVFVIGLIIMLGFAIATVLDIAAF